MTANELNNDRFEIEKSMDGESYTKIGTLKGAGNSTTLFNYHFIDAFNTTEKVTIA